jgi:hypothetical protein
VQFVSADTIAFIRVPAAGSCSRVAACRLGNMRVLPLRRGGLGCDCLNEARTSLAAPPLLPLPLSSRSPPETNTRSFPTCSCGGTRTALASSQVHWWSIMLGFGFSPGSKTLPAQPPFTWPIWVLSCSDERRSWRWAIAEPGLRGLSPVLLLPCWVLSDRDSDSFSIQPSGCGSSAAGDRGPESTSASPAPV